MDNKRGVVNLSTFAFIIVLFFLLFGFSYFFYNSSMETIDTLKKENYLITAMIEFRSNTINLVERNNSYINYSQHLYGNNVIFYINNSKIKGEIDSDNKIITKEISNYGIRFCSNYSFISNIENSFYYNGSCISLITT